MRRSDGHARSTAVAGVCRVLALAAADPRRARRRRQARLAAVARAGSHRPVEGDRRSSGSGRRRAGAAVDGVQPRRRLWLGGGQRRSHLRPGHARRTRASWSSAEPRRRQGALVEGARTGGRQRSRTRAARHADGRRRSGLRADRERRPRLPAGQRMAPSVWQRNILKDFGGREHPLADQRVAARRRQPADRHAGRTRAPAWSRSTR